MIEKIIRKWWFYVICIVLLFIPSIVQQPVSPEKASQVVQEVMQNPLIYKIKEFFPIAKVWIIFLLTGVFIWRNKFRKMFTVCRDFFIPYSGKDDEFTETFSHAGESETSLGLLLFPDMIDMRYAVDGKPKTYFKSGWFDNSITDYGRPHQWFEGEGHAAIEIAGSPEGVLGASTISSAKKAKRPVIAMCRILVELIDNILEVFPAGTVPPVEEITLRNKEDMIPYLKEPMSEGWKSAYGLPKIGDF